MYTKDRDYENNTFEYEASTSHDSTVLVRACGSAGREAVGATGSGRGVVCGGLVVGGGELDVGVSWLLGVA